ncbi:MAG: hypothetical protein ACXWC9_09950 [Pseudobdellovibrionaceae bacterium]
MGTIQDRRSDRLLLFRKGRGIWILAAFASALLLLILVSLRNSNAAEVSLRDLTSLDKVSAAVSETLMPTTQTLPKPLQIRIEGLFAQIESHPESKESLLRELKRVLQQNFKGQEDCWSCAGSEYFDRFDAIAGGQESRKPMGLKEWIALGDEAFANQRLDEARESYIEALQMVDERAFQPDEAIDTESLDRLTSRCLELNCR